MKYLSNTILFWLPMPVIGTLNGFFRGMVLMQFMSEYHAKQVSSVMLIILLFFYTFLIFEKLHIQKGKDALVIGFVWMIMTISFEFLLGVAILHQQVEVMLSEYDLRKGNLWSVVLLAILFIPYANVRLGKDRIHKTTSV